MLFDMQTPDGENIRYSKKASVSSPSVLDFGKFQLQTYKCFHARIHFSLVDCECKYTHFF